MFTTVTTNLRLRLTAAKPSVVLSEVLYYFIAVVLLFSGVSKVIDPMPMIETIKAAFKVNENLLILTSTLLPIIEIILGLMMVLQIQTKKALLITTVLFFAFFVFSIYGLVRHLVRRNSNWFER